MKRVIFSAPLGYFGSGSAGAGDVVSAAVVSAGLLSSSGGAVVPSGAAVATVATVLSEGASSLGLMPRTKDSAISAARSVAITSLIIV